MTFHPSQDPEYFKHVIEIGVSKDSISDNEAELITTFIEEREIKKTQIPIKPIRKTKLAQSLVSFRQFLKPQYQDSTIEDFKNAIRLLNASDYSQNSKNDFIVISKSFFVWLAERENPKITAKELSEILGPGASTPDIDEKDLITRDELYKIIKACKNLRDRAFIATLYESAARVSELANAKWGDLDYKDNGVVIITLIDEKMSHKGEKKKKRQVPLLMATEFLAGWRTAYPGNPVGDNPIFTDSITGGLMEYTAVLRQVTRAAKRAGITKRANPHTFRKSRLTEMAREHYSDAVIRSVGWNNQSTKMADIYIKIGEDAVTTEFLERQGIKKREDKPKDNLPRQCGFCFSMNSPISEYCHKCGKPLTREAAGQINSEREAIRAAGSEYVRAEDVERIVRAAVDAALKK